MSVDISSFLVVDIPPDVFEILNVAGCCMLWSAMTLEQELERVQTYVPEATPSNESETCEWIILPLLWACGYARYEIRSRTGDGAGRFPDYTILPGTPHTWFLEAKSWKESLRSEHVDQALYSAFSTGNRWVVLTNGRDWQLFDTTLPGTSKDRLVTSASLLDDSIRSFLRSLSRESVLNGELNEFGRAERLRMVLAKQLSSNDSEVIAAIRNVLYQRFGFADLSDESLICALQCVLFSASPPGSAQAVSDEAYQPPSNLALGDPAQQCSVQMKVAEPRSTVKDQRLKAKQFLLTPVKADRADPAKDVISRLLKQGWYAFGERTPGRKDLKPGDCICFYESGVGIVADAVVRSMPERAPAPGVRDSDHFPWRFKVGDVKTYFDKPVRLDVALRSRLDAFANKAPDRSWSWFVQGTMRLTEHDFLLLTRYG